MAASTATRLVLQTWMEGLLVTTDNVSPEGAWRTEWDAQSHTPTEYREKIRELRQRNQEYIREIEKLKEKIDDLKEELAIVHKHIYRNRDNVE
jgi:predicted RNase H-like nuclease (RuvC/YqgF family)